MTFLRALYSGLKNLHFVTCLAALGLVALVAGAGIDSAKAQGLLGLPAGCTSQSTSGTGTLGTTITCPLPGGGTATATCNTSATATGGVTTCTGIPNLGTFTEAINSNGTVTISDRCGSVTTTVAVLQSAGGSAAVAPLTACLTQAGTAAQAALALRASLPSVVQAASQAGLTVVQGQITSIRDAIQRRQNAAAGGGGALGFADPLEQAYGSTRGARAALYTKAAPAAPKTNDYGLAVWGQGFGDYEQRTGTFNGMDIGRVTRTWGFVGGIDKMFTSLANANDALVLGLLSGDTTTGVDSALGNSAHISGPSVGAYGIYVNGGFSTDLTFKADFFGIDQTQVGGTTSFGVNNYTEAFNVNNKYALNPAWWLEPTVGFLHTNTAWNNAASALGMIDGETWRVQGGARVGWSGIWNATQVDGTLTALAYDDVSIRGGTISTITAPLVPTDEGKLFGQLIGKLNFEYGNGLSSYVEGEVRGRDGVFGAAGRVGLRYKF
jgi:hypothetical protein